MKKFLILLLLISMASRVSAFEADSCRRAPQIIAGAAGALAINAAATEVLKHSIHEMRPNRADNHSFPSRHTSWAFAAATAFSHELYRNSPWWSAGAHAIAGAIGYQRVVSGNHYGSDVVAGEITGILSAELSYFICSRIWRNSGNTTYSTNTFRTNIAIATEAMFHLGKPLGTRLCTGYALSARIRIPIAENWGVAASMRTCSSPLQGMAQTLESTGITAGLCGHHTLPCSFLAVEPVVEAGYSILSGTKKIPHSTFSFNALGECGISMRLTPKFAVRAAAGIMFSTYSKAAVGINASLGSVAVF
ncbi:MAG: phosphatase PAP2 family protein [Muribaculaceae bacterium]|nr:phosphatase PAP2 family protein [Muribaculaceae bacterium]